jgi:hypothetical protein
MRARGIRFGFVTTYKETVFLKISPLSTEKEKYGLYHSGIISHNDTVKIDPLGEVTQVSTRLGLLYLLHRVSHEDENKWCFKPEKIE